MAADAESISHEGLIHGAYFLRLKSVLIGILQLSTWRFSMKKLFASAVIVMLAGGSVAAQDDPVKAREALMTAAAGAAGISVPMLRGQMDYHPAVAKAAIATFYGVSRSAHVFFPEGSAGETKASAKIWEDPEGFQAAFDKFEAAASAAFEASGKDGPADLQAFQQAVAPVLETCGSCHETYRLE